MEEKLKPITQALNDYRTAANDVAVLSIAYEKKKWEAFLASPLKTVADREASGELEAIELKLAREKAKVEMWVQMQTVLSVKGLVLRTAQVEESNGQ